MAIQFALDGLSYALLDTQSQAIVAFECYLSDSQMDGDDLFRTLEQALETKGLNNNAFQSVSCVVDNRFCTLVPVPLFNEAEKKQYLDFAFNVPEDYVILSELLVSAQCRNAFAFPKVLHDKVLTKWKEAKITHSSSVFIESLMQKRINQGVFVNVRNYDFESSRRKKILFISCCLRWSKTAFRDKTCLSVVRDSFSLHQKSSTFADAISRWYGSWNNRNSRTARV